MSGLGVIRGVSVIIRDGARFLILKRAARVRHFPGKWECVSGKIEPFETALDAARREVSEETGLEVRVRERPLSVLETRLGDNALTLTYFVADYVSGVVRLSREHSAFGWYDEGRLLELDLHAETAALVKELQPS